MFSMKKNKLLVSINNFIEGMHVIFNDINVNGKAIWAIEHREVPKYIELGFEVFQSTKHNFQKQQ